MNSRSRFAAACLLIAALPSAWAAAATTGSTQPKSASGAGGATAASSADGSSGLEVVVVTAERRSENLQHAALSITALSGDEIADTGKVSLDTALSGVAAVRIQGASNGAQIYIRGVGSNADSQLGDPAVNLNFDGIYQAETEAAMAGLYDVQRIEVLRGPQGTLYGRNATAGAVNVVTNDPTHDLGGYVNIQGGNYAALTTEAAGNIPLTENAALRIAFSSQRHDGYLSNGNDDLNSTSGRLKLLVEPVEHLRMLFAGEYTHIRDNGFGTVEAPLSKSDPYASSNPAGYRAINAWSAHTQIDYGLDWATLTLEAGHNDFVKDEANVLLAGPSVPDHRTGSQNTVEIRAASADSSRVKWVGGLYYLNDDEFKSWVPSFINVAPIPPSNPELRFAGTQSYATFANVTVPLTEWLRVTGGIRYTHDKKTATYVYTDGSGTPNVNAADTWDSVTYKGEVEADLTANSLAYAQVSSGFKAGGFAQQFPAGAYNPERLTAYEVGSKNTFLDNRLTVNGSAFYYDYKEYQASYPDIVGGSFAIVTSNAATATLYGADVEAHWRATPDDTFGISASYLHTKFGKFVYTSILSGATDHSDQTLPQSPELSGDVSYEHVFELAEGSVITAHVNAHLSDGYWTTVERTPDAYQPAFTRTDAYLMYQPAEGNWNVRVFVNNIEDTPVRTLGLANPFDSVLMLAAPRVFGVGAGVKF